MGEASGVEPAKALTEARAGQILAEMLGMVCHPEYVHDGKIRQYVPRSHTAAFNNLLTS